MAFAGRGVLETVQVDSFLQSPLAVRTGQKKKRNPILVGKCLQPSVRIVKGVRAELFKKRFAYAGVGVYLPGHRHTHEYEIRGAAPPLYLTRDRAGALCAGAAKCKLSVGREIKTDIPADVH